MTTRENVEQNIELFQGETKRLNVTVYDENREVVTVPGDALLVYVITDYKPTDANQILKKEVGAGISISGGQILVDLFRADTLELSPGRYYHELRWYDNMINGEANVIMHGLARVIFSATKTVAEQP